MEKYYFSGCNWLYLNKQSQPDNGDHVLVRVLMVTAAGSGLNIAPAVTLLQSHGYSVDIPMLNSGINKYTGSGDAQYDSGVLQVTLDTHQSVSPFVICSTDLGPTSGYYAPNGELEMVYSSNTFEGSGSFVILNSSALAPPNLGMVQIGNVYSFGFADTVLSVRNVILNIKLPESGKGAHLNLYGWDINNARWIEIPGGNYNLDYFSISLASLMEYPAYGLFALLQANDPVPPGPVSGLRATTGDKLWNIDLQWTLPNDTDLSALDIRFNTEPVSMANWQQCQAISNKLEPATPGSIQHTSVEMPDPGTMYYFGIMAIDVSGNVSPLTTLNTPVRSNATDADGDGIPDLWETSNGLNPIVSDAADDDDGDMRINLEEYQYRTAPYNSDTDKDGYSDGDEIAQGTDPNDFESFPDPLLYGGCEGDSWVPEVHFKYEDSNFKETMAWISGWSYSLTEIGKYNKAYGIKGAFCLPECGYISSKFLLDFLNNKYYGQHVTSKSATKTIWEGVLKLYKCSD
ncbi:MAG: hypothetical protein HC877_20500 [Thioploca sp.]|nr:hypothetical protein [Thioploca sp.]